jgi:hypothetical protein
MERARENGRGRSKEGTLGEEAATREGHTGKTTLLGGKFPRRWGCRMGVCAVIALTWIAVPLR